MKKKDFETFSKAYIQTDTFKTLVIEKHLIDFPFDKSEQKFDYIRSVLKYEDRLTLLIVGLFLLGVLFFTIYEGEFSWWHLLGSLIFISPFLGVIYYFIERASNYKLLLEKARPYIKEAYDEYLKERNN